MLYQVTLYSPNRYERCYDATRTWIVGTQRAAELEAKRLLPPASETDHSARRARHPYIEVVPVRRHCPLACMGGGREYRAVGAPVACYETPIVYVPSCGDLGWTP